MSPDAHDIAATHLDEVVIGVDGHEGGRDAVALAIALGSRRLTLAGAYAYDSRVSADIEHYRRLLHDDMVAALEVTRVHLGVVVDFVSVAEPSPAKALHRIADERGAELLVIGSDHHGALGRMVLGDVSRGVLNGSPCPVAIAPRRYHERPHRPETVAVGYDGSVESHEALQLGRRLAAAHDAALEVHVVWQGATFAIAAAAYTEDVERLAAEDRERAAGVLRDALAELPEKTHGELHHGSPWSELQHVSEHADVLLLGSRGLGPVRRVALGSTSDRVVHHAQCPVIVVPRPATVPPDAPSAAEATAASR